MKRSKNITHCIAECMTCGKTWQWFLTARQQGYRHARTTGHHVMGEVGLSFDYNKPIKK